MLQRRKTKTQRPAQHLDPTQTSANRPTHPLPRPDGGQRRHRMQRNRTLWSPNHQLPLLGRTNTLPPQERLPHPNHKKHGQDNQNSQENPRKPRKTQNQHQNSVRETRVACANLGTLHRTLPENKN